MGYIDNEIIRRELANNYAMHEIFERQRYSTLEQTFCEIQESGLGNILLELNGDNITKLYKHRTLFTYGSVEFLTYWNHIISLCFMKQLRDKYNIETDHDLDEEEKIFTEDSFEDYLHMEDILVKRDDVFAAISSLNMDNTRLHIVVRCCLNGNICNELSNYLKDELPFITMMYSDGSLTLFRVMLDNGEQRIEETLYKYKIFKEYNEGRDSLLAESKSNKKILQKKQSNNQIDA